MKPGVMRWAGEGSRARSHKGKKALRTEEFALYPEGSGEPLKES